MLTRKLYSFRKVMSVSLTEIELFCVISEHISLKSVKAGYEHFEVKIF